MHLQENLPRQLSAVPERRELTDRRRTCSLFVDWRWTVRGRRRELRRTTDSSGVCLDWHPPALFVVALGIVLLSSLDAGLTLILQQRGATEVNPIMTLLIERDVQLFVNIKLFMTTFPLVLMVAHSGIVLFHRWKVAQLVHGLFGTYVVLIGYELLLLNATPGVG
jgi:hypothetical protein